MAEEGTEINLTVAGSYRHGAVGGGNGCSILVKTSKVCYMWGHLKGGW